MEQPESVIGEVFATIYADCGETQLIHGKIFEPFQPENVVHWRCRTSCPELFGRDATLVGVDAKQAKEFAALLYQRLLEDRLVEGTDVRVVWRN